MPRFFIDQEPAGEYFVGGENGAHMVKSLRMRPGEKTVLCAGTGKDFLCTLLECREDGALVRVDEVTESRGEPKVRVTVCQCRPKGDKLETVVQKAVELGAWEILPVESARCISRPDEKAAEKKGKRLQKVALEAAQQSGRGRVPTVLPPVTLEEALKSASEQGDILFCYENGTHSLKETLRSSGGRLFLFIGPEGGFAPEEAELAERYGAKVVTLGNRILRTETAPLAALSAILYEYGEFEL